MIIYAHLDADGVFLSQMTRSLMAGRLVAASDIQAGCDA